MSCTQAIPQGKDMAIERDLFVSLELSDKKWVVTAQAVGGKVSRQQLCGGDTAALLDRLARLKARAGLPPQARVHTCYEAGRDGWWLHRWLLAQGIDNIVVDSASIERRRRSRSAKTDRLDGEKLLSMLVRYRGGESGLWSVVRAPSVEDEDARRPQRELQRLKHERTGHTNRIGSLLVLHNLRQAGAVGSKAWMQWWAAQCEQVPQQQRAEIERELQRLALVQEQIRLLERARQRAMTPMAVQLKRLCGIGPVGAVTLSTELLGWRQFSNRRQLAACVGLAPTPYDSGNSRTEQGISKSGSRRLRALLVELSWRWLRLQPDSDLTAWFTRRFAKGGARMRRIGIVALARRLLIALWRFAQHGEIPAGAKLRADPLAQPT